MSGYSIVCQNSTNDVKCSKTISAASKEELLKLAVEHMTSVHGLKRTRGLEDQIRARMKKSKPAA